MLTALLISQEKGAMMMGRTRWVIGNARRQVRARMVRERSDEDQREAGADERLKGHSLHRQI